MATSPMRNPREYVRGYLRSYVTHDGEDVIDEPAVFTQAQSNSHHGMYFDPDNGYRRKDAEELVAHWNWLGEANGQTFRLA